MNDIWEILGIAPTKNKKEIRAAYAAKSKQYHPEEEPEEFAKLNRAYKTALDYITNHVVEENSTDFAVEDKEIVQKYFEEEKTDGEEGPGDSLLSRLQDSEESELKKSMESGALKKFISVFDKAKESGKFPRANVFKELFLSEEFLREQDSERFAKGLIAYLSDWKMEGNYHIFSLPDAFLVELAVAYALIPEREYFDTVIDSENEAEVFEKELAAYLWSRQQREYLPYRILEKPENLVRLRSFSDYSRLRNLNRQNALTRENKSAWDELLLGGSVNHIYELNGKGQRNIYPQTRSETLILLFTFWLQNENVPECILEQMYQRYDLKSIERSSREKLYATLKREILKQYPAIEEKLFGAESKTQMISSWYREFTKIIADAETEYKKGIYEESDAIRSRVKQLFEKDTWRKIQDSKELFEKIYLQLFDRETIPESMAERLFTFYSREEWLEENENVTRMLENILLTVSFGRKVRERNKSLSILHETAHVDAISDNHIDFWSYYLMVGFGFKFVELESGPYRKYLKGSRCYLPYYMKCMYEPSVSWRKLFTGVDDRNGEPAFLEFILPDHRKFRVEFHFHYCLYFLDDQPVYGTEYTWEECLELSESLEKTEQKFFLLAITSVEWEERRQAIQTTQKWLSNLKLYQFTIPLIASMLTAGPEELLEDDEESNIHIDDVQAVYYKEQGRFCFRAIVVENAVILSYKSNFGWQYLDAHVAATGQEDMHLWAKSKLECFRQPKAVTLSSVSLEGMDHGQKAEKIVEALLLYGKFKSKKENDLTESYCVLRYGVEKKREEIFYYALRPYELRSIDGRSYSYWENVEDLEKKIKEEHEIVGSLYLSNSCNPEDEFILQPFAVGISGTYYMYDVYHMQKANHLAELIAKKFDLSNVTQVDTYEGFLSISNLDGQFEYCYGKEKFKESAYCMEAVTTDLFTRFTKAEMMQEFADWLDDVLAQELSEFGMLCFAFHWDDKNSCSLNLFRQSKYQIYEGDSEEENGSIVERHIEKYCTGILNGKKQLAWKIWNGNRMYMGFTTDESLEIIHWYMDYGKFGKKLKDCLKVDVICHSKQVVNVKSILNTEGIFEALRKRTVTTAYLLEMKKGKQSGIFDSKFGGMPYWTPDREYPTNSNGKKLLLLAQINLDKTPMKELAEGGGMLQFFGNSEEIFQKDFGSRDDMDQYRVIYHETIDYHISRNELEALGVPDSTSPENQTIPTSKELAMDITQNTVYMSVGDYRFDGELREAIREKFGVTIGDLTYQDVFEDEIDEVRDEFCYSGNWILGYPSDLIISPEYPRNDPREWNEDFRRYDRLLFQFDVHYLDYNNYYYDNGGCGIAGFYIQSEDLKKKNFDHILYHWGACKMT